VISASVSQFLQDPNIDTEYLISQIVTAFHKINDELIILTSRWDNNMEFPALSRTIENRAKNEFDVTKPNFSIYNNGRLKRVSVIEMELTNVSN
jgi:hypothetical protein